MDAPFRATHQTKRMLYEMMLCAEHRGAYVGYVRGGILADADGLFPGGFECIPVPLHLLLELGVAGRMLPRPGMAVFFAAAVGHKPAGKAVHAGGEPYGPCECPAALYRGRRVLLAGKAGPV